MIDTYRVLGVRIHAVQIPGVLEQLQGWPSETGRTRQAPTWMRENGLEWSVRLGTEPRRLWKRYLLGGGEFGFRLLTDVVTGRFREGQPCSEKIARSWR